LHARGSTSSHAWCLELGSIQTGEYRVDVFFEELVDLLG
jgi:hypothetical protein